MATGSKPVSGFDWASVWRKRVKAPAIASPGAAAGGTPLWPAQNTFDPTIQLNADSAQRGLGDTLVDYTRDFGEPGTALGGRQGFDYSQARGLLQKSLDRANQDFGTNEQEIEGNYGQSLADLMTARTRGTEDHTAALGELSRGYGQLGNRQRQAANAAGVSGGGALAQALAKRTANEAHDRVPIDTNFSRFLADSQTAEGRLGETHTRAVSALALARQRAAEDAATQGAGLDTGYLRGGEDAATQLARAMRENQQFQLGSRQQAIYQAGPPAAVKAPAKKKTKKK